jgi:TBC1 domain family member 5
VRLDDVMRAEIQQDVQRLPDEPFYRLESTQTTILDILFIYCKMNPDVGGYRQGMHELLAPFVYVLDQDAVDRADAANRMTDDDDAALDPAVVEACDYAFVEHDAFALFSKLMSHAKPFYETGDPTGFGPDHNTIVEKSKLIHEVALAKVDPELSHHLTSIEILPQIFLIRWIRLLFGREFPFDRLLVLWDTIFAFDPSLDLIDLICVAMLLRVRWTLLEADYSGALQLLLKYPAPEPAAQGPHTFVDDALYLRDHLSVAGGANLVLKYSGRSPAVSQTTHSAGRTGSVASSSGLLSQSLRQRTMGTSSRSSLRPLSQAGSVEALFQGAAKGMLERGEKLGINQAVREAVGEIRRNVQGLQTSVRNSPASASASASSGVPSMAVMERRNRQLSAMLDETVSSLKQLAASKLEEERDKVVETIELAAAKIQFVKVYLEDSSLAVPGAAESSTIPSYKGASGTAPTVALDTTEVTTTTAVEDAMAALSMPSSPPITTTDQTGTARPQSAVQASPTPKARAASLADPSAQHDRMDTDEPINSPKATATASNLNPDMPVSGNAEASQSAPDLATAANSAAFQTNATATKERPSAPIPTRSTLAQSSFAWMLEPDASTTAPFPSPPSAQQQQQALEASQAGDSSMSSSSLPLSSSSSAHQRTRRKPNNASRERNAFLFGEVTADAADGADGGLSADRIFGLQPIRKR